MATFDAAAARLDIKFTEGDDNTVSIDKMRDGDGNVQDITGWTFWLTAKAEIGDADADAVIQEEVTSHTDPTDGQTDIVIARSDTEALTGNYYYDIQRKDDTDDIKTLVWGTLTFTDEVTEAT